MDPQICLGLDIAYSFHGLRGATHPHTCHCLPKAQACVFTFRCHFYQASLVAQMVENLPAMQKT